MIRRLYSILYFVFCIPLAIGILAAYLTFPVWLVVWVLTGWWVYPPGNALLHNITGWLMVRSATKPILKDGARYYSKEDYADMRHSLKTQSFD